MTPEEHPVITLVRGKVADPSAPFSIVADLDAQPGRGDELAAAVAASGAVALTRAEPGCLGYDLVRDTDAPDRFVAYEGWRDRAALAAHLGTPHFAAVGAAVGGLLAGPPAVRVLTPVGAGGAGATVPAPLPPDDPSRDVTVARPASDPALPHVAVAGGVYTILVTGEQSGGRYGVIDMFVPPGGGPPPHRHDFEEMFLVLEGEVEFTFRGRPVAARAGDTVSIPANAPHAFRNASAAPARLLCTVSPAGGEQMFLEVGDPVPTRTGPVPTLDAAARAERVARAKSLAAKYRTELL